MNISDLVKFKDCTPTDVLLGLGLDIYNKNTRNEIYCVVDIAKRSSGGKVIRALYLETFTNTIVIPSGYFMIDEKYIRLATSQEIERAKSKKNWFKMAKRKDLVEHPHTKIFK